MTSSADERWKKLDALFYLALELQGEAHANYIDHPEVMNIRELRA